VSGPDLAIVGAGPAGAAAAIGALAARRDLSVVLLDRAEFPRDKPCGDGIAPHALEALADHGVTGLIDDWAPVHRLRLERGQTSVSRRMRRPARVVPRTVFDARLLEAAVAHGAELQIRRVRSLDATSDGVRLDDALTARVVIGADGAHSVVARAVGRPASGGTAFALRGYAPTPPERTGEQVIVFGDTRQPSYAWSFDRGDGQANVGYGELIGQSRSAGQPPPSRQLLLEQLERLLPGSTDGGRDWRGHHLPLTSPRWRPAPGRVLLAGDAASLINPLTGEGIYYAVLTGLLAGRSAAVAISEQAPSSAGARYAAAVAPLRRHLRHTGLSARLSTAGAVLDAGLGAAARDQGVFDGLVELGLAHGTLDRRLVTGLASALALGAVRSGVQSISMVTTRGGT
jgi:geranylgeranyl reductase family protein